MNKEIDVVISVNFPEYIKYAAISGTSILGFKHKPVYNQRWGVWECLSGNHFLGEVWSCNTNRGLTLYDVSDNKLILKLSLHTFPFVPQYMAIDACGSIYLYEKEPEKLLSLRIWDFLGGKYLIFAQILPEFLPKDWNWENTLKKISDYVK